MAPGNGGYEHSGGSYSHRNVDNHLHGVITKKTTIQIITTVKTPNLKQDFCFAFVCHGLTQFFTVQTCF
jgi:hypothetical protein